MKISNLTSDLEERFGLLNAVKMNCDAGFEAIDVTMYGLGCELLSQDADRLIAEMKKIADSYGIVFNQAHSPFPHYLFGSDREDDNRKMHEGVLRSIEIAGALGCSQIIVHPIEVKNVSADEQLNFNLELFSDFVDAGRKNHVGIAIENMWGRHRDAPVIVPNVCSLGEELARYVDAFRDPIVTACLDIGHAGLVGTSADRMVRELGGKRLSSLHVHDNDFVGDNHSYPFTGKLNFAALMRALAEVDYRGDLTFEASSFLHGLPDELCMPATKYLFEIGKYLRSQFETERGKAN